MGIPAWETSESLWENIFQIDRERERYDCQPDNHSIQESYLSCLFHPQLRWVLYSYSSEKKIIIMYWLVNRGKKVNKPDIISCSVGISFLPIKHQSKPVLVLHTLLPYYRGLWELWANHNIIHTVKCATCLSLMARGSPSISIRQLL